ncbi:MAG: hypothetical protein HY343_07600 [Lentisphaerae bacterium]|nr:hypothetical protein [Lentisphaerota bacterium]
MNERSPAGGSELGRIDAGAIALATLLNLRAIYRRTPKRKIGKIAGWVGEKP